MNYALEEKKLSEKLSQILSDDFEITNEHEIRKRPGTFILDNKPFSLYPDLLIRPKKHLIEEGYFVDTIIPVEVKNFNKVECNKFEDLLFQCHSYRFSSFENEIPKLCLYFIDNIFDRTSYNNELAKDTRTEDYQTKKNVQEKNRTENLFGRFGIGEIVTRDHSYFFRLKRQELFASDGSSKRFKPEVLNLSLGTGGNRKKWW